MDCRYNLDKYFGKVGEGVDSYRVFNIAIVDVIATIIGAFLIYLVMPYIYKPIRFIYILIALFLLGIILHRVFCARTTIDRLLF